MPLKKKPQKSPQDQIVESFIADDTENTDFQKFELNTDTGTSLEKDVVEIASNLSTDDKIRLKNLWKTKAKVHTNLIAELLMQHSAIKEALSDVTEFSSEMSLGVGLLDESFVENVNSAFTYALSKYITDVFILDSKTSDRESAIYKHVFSILVSSSKQKSPVIPDKKYVDDILASIKPEDPYGSNLFGKTSDRPKYSPAIKKTVS
jgi:hypothetical protein